MLELCKAPPLLLGNHADDIARALFALYGLYAMCAGMHANLVQWIETEGAQWPMK